MARQARQFIHPMDRRDENWMSAAAEAQQELNEHLERKSRRVLPQNRLVDVLVMPDGRLATIERGSAYHNFWRNSGFAGTGYLVCVAGVEIAQTGTRFEALQAVREGKPLTEITKSGLAALALAEAS